MAKWLGRPSHWLRPPSAPPPRTHARTYFSKWQIGAIPRGLIQIPDRAIAIRKDKRRLWKITHFGKQRRNLDFAMKKSRLRRPVIASDGPLRSDTQCDALRRNTQSGETL